MRTCRRCCPTTCSRTSSAASRPAASRCVCRAWRAVVDARRLLRAELLPLSPAGIFINFHGYDDVTELFSRPSSSPVSGMRHYLPEAGGRSWGYVRDHCHGLLLVDGAGRDDYHRPLQYVLNPATRRVAPLPLRRPPHVEVNSCEDRYLAYDPADSPHYQVVSVTRFLCKREPSDIFYDRPNYQLDPLVERSEWPPSLYTLHVLSSRTGRWEERSFARQGGAAGTVADMRHSPHEKQNAVYWRGALYVHCQTDFVTR
ncbi:hypothetical protein C2845_PM02G03130 [Panicum miliaceum]|uniref:F-box domain-containing protein n=1 Tax=Panicum miliaceum TaxID=4540 RepID=A0A3L6S8C6_PANMI|nr:hypothetical protein C2845_PM02G03130 [Panicum miliaceum]